ncbi:MAG: DNA mismatch repair protein MutS [Rhizobiales bacterium 65-9]|nr:DNA mismatch repair protein MutS [Hyphomicrobiales bacterium]OJY35069.1 MAG: DNA mismatch repair protein MutS [Rhizobiales bacterium 65-9]
MLERTKPDAAGAGAADKPTPMMAQYLEIKAANPDCLLFYRMGDFYELFFEDAETASRALGIVLTKRGKHRGEDIRMCGVPVERANDYLQRLIALGHRVAVCEQIEDPAEARKRGAKSVVKRDVVRLVTPGTVTEEALLDPAGASLLVALARVRASEQEWSYGVAAVDITTGQFTLSETTAAGLGAEIARLDPKEIVLPDSIHDDPALKQLWRDMRASLTPIPRDGHDGSAAERRLLDFYGVATLDGFGVFSRAEISAAATAVAYVNRTQKGKRAALSPPTRADGRGVMRIDQATRANLELTRTLGGQRDGSLLAAIDRTQTPGGGRLLAERLAGPLTDVAAIQARQDSIAFFLDDRALRDATRDTLRRAPDGARALARLSLDRGGPRDLIAIRDMIAAAHALAAALSDRIAVPAELAAAVGALRELDQALAERLTSAIVDEPPLMKRDGGFVRAGCESALDEMRRLRDESRRVIAELQMRHAEETGVRNLRIKHNNFLGYFIEVPQAAGEQFLKPPLNAIFIHRQTMQGAMRFSTAALGELEQKIASAADRALALELSIFADLNGAVVAAGETIKRAALALCAIDVAAALADIAADLNWTRPLVDDSRSFAIAGGRHPVVEAALRRTGDPFVANDAELSAPARDGGGRIMLVTGPNMAGKSTYLRQNALIATLAQMGAYTPARDAHIGVVDRLFSRVGAADDLARGRSTFMVEMIETAAILNQATDRSLVILDEIGRGTATFDGLSIAWATIEHLHEINRCRALFATHYHELTTLAKKLPRVTNATMRVTDFEGDVIFLHEVTAGAADRSYGIQVAKLAGLPTSVVERARTILSELEATERTRPRKELIEDLPLFAALDKQAATPAAKKDDLREALAALRPDEMTPREALETLYQLKGLAAG